MGCNCKKKIDAINSKYGEGGSDSENTNFIFKFFKFISQIALGIICGIIIIVMIIPMLGYVVYCLMFGKQPTFRIKNLNKYVNMKQ